MFLKNLIFLMLLICLSFSNSEAAVLSPVDSSSLEGKWDLTIMINGEEKPSWLEVCHSGNHAFVGRFVGVSGSARPIARVIIRGNKFRFTIPAQWETGDEDLMVEATFDQKVIEGTITFPDGKSYDLSGVRAPQLSASKEVRWGKPRDLIQKNTLKGWKALGENQWVVEEGILRSPKSGANLVTEERFKDFKLHVEFRYPAGSNSGIYLRGRYELQIMDKNKKEPLSEELGGIYGFIAPLEQVAKAPGEWQTYDITLVGRVVTVVANGVTIISSQAIPGITGGALDSNEGEPGPLMLQGDHGPIEYRNIVITTVE